ncbi:restriction system protein [Desulfatibacillum alkenivorans DSM 16219]|jgi:restriction system protein|uniref:Restriction system protein n=1 Tax=Desulfatibacillum alkenivorans DSM 16219 TaxID=1121393 RepID=A0A1M6T2B0_9BACT|nr:restriction endonuclease [Desulfatibacillum alkenivorans]SHK51039.1 restriction system protein [Desulfatibacillum alkenivorans DSM 16219]
MSVPDFQSFFKPLLEFASDGAEHSMKEAREAMKEYFSLDSEDLSELLPSGRQRKFDNRIAWAKSYFVQAKVFEATKWAHFKITDRGRELRQQGHDRIDIKVLNQYPEFVEFHSANLSKPKDNETEKNGKAAISETPEEILANAYKDIRKELASEILDILKTNSPQFFEKLVVDLMIALGYGGSLEDAGKSVGQSHDGGIDGIIKEDRLGLDAIYLQAKRWEGTVGRPEIQKFVGALIGKRGKKGVFITTAVFSKDAVEYSQNIDSKVVLIDGRQLAEFMIDFNIGTSVKTAYEIKTIDSDYFNED